MKKINKIFLSLALVLILALPMLAGCDFFGNNKKLLAYEIEGNIKTEYYLGEQLNVQDVKLNLIYEDNSTVKIPLDSSMITGFDTSTLGNKQITIEYNKVKRTIDYSVKFRTGMYEATMTSGNQTHSIYIEFLEDGKAYNYAVAEEDKVGVYENFTWEQNNDKLYVDFFDLHAQAYTNDNDTFTVEYTASNNTNISVSFRYKQTLQNRTSKTLKNIAIVGNLPTSYVIGDRVDFTMCALRATFEDNSTMDIQLNDNMVENFSTTTVGDRTMTIKFMGKSLEIDYCVNSFYMGQYDFVAIYYYNGSDIVATDTEFYAGSGYLFSYHFGKIIKDGQVVQNSSVMWAYDKNNRVDGSWTVGSVEEGSFLFDVLTSTKLGYIILKSGTKNGINYDHYVIVYENTTTN